VREVAHDLQRARREDPRARDTVPGTEIPILQGTLSYGTRLVCGVYCQVEGSAGAPTMLFCQFNCPSGSAAVQVSFTVGPTVCQ
jgi:hypothetical protein